MRDLQLAQHWEQLHRSRSAGTGGYVVTRIAPDGRWDFWVALVKPGDTRALLMGLGKPVPALSTPLPASRGFSTRLAASVPPGLRTASLLEVHLDNPAFQDIFDVLIGDLVRAAEQHLEESGAVQAVLGQLRKWQRFVQKVPPEGLSSEQRRGLFGELYVLRDYMIPALGFLNSIAAWTGPAGAHQDFQGSGFGVEVKTSSAKEPQTMRIASERQLDDSGLAMLLLCHLSLEEKAGTGETLPSIIADLREKAAALALEAELEEKLYEAGYHDVHAPLYSKLGFVVRGLNFYRVERDFPRILESELRPGVGTVVYSIAASECGPYQLEAEDFRGLLEAFGDD